MDIGGNKVLRVDRQHRLEGLELRLMPLAVLAVAMLCQCPDRAWGAFLSPIGISSVVTIVVASVGAAMYYWRVDSALEVRAGDEGLHYRRGPGAERFMPWTDIADLREGLMTMRIALLDHEGRVLARPPWKLEHFDDLLLLIEQRSLHWRTQDAFPMHHNGLRHLLAQVAVFWPPPACASRGAWRSSMPCRSWGHSPYLSRWHWPWWRSPC
ncbi:MAG: hypothetical protein GC168_00920 [Candidatus Hydrogenedens sp.]|nr:hypothetical protein [Candidatus Hydrogenedens sp.]